jgi:hypothetical protein
MHTHKVSIWSCGRSSSFFAIPFPRALAPCTVKTHCLSGRGAPVRCGTCKARESLPKPALFCPQRRRQRGGGSAGPARNSRATVCQRCERERGLAYLFVLSGRRRRCIRWVSSHGMARRRARSDTLGQSQTGADHGEGVLVFAANWQNWTPEWKGKAHSQGGRALGVNRNGWDKTVRSGEAAIARF